MPSSPGKRWRRARDTAKGIASGRKRHGVQQGRLDLGIVFSAQDRAGRIQQGAARPEQGPRGIEQARLQRHQRIEVTGAAVQEHVGLAAHDPRGRAGRIDEDGVEGLAVPPGRRRGGVGNQGACGRIDALAHAEAAPGGAHALQPRGVDVDGEQAQAGIALEQMPELRTGAEQARARARRWGARASAKACAARTVRDLALGESRRAATAMSREKTDPRAWPPPRLRALAQRSS